MGHEVAIFAFFGLQGTKIDWNDIPIFPNNPRDWGTTDALMWYNYWKADLLISLIDIGVITALGMGDNSRINWCPICPVDHEPVPPLTIKTIKESPNIVKVLTEARFGQEQLREHSIDAGYISHPTNTDIFAPRQENRDYWRKTYQWEDKFVIGTVGTNHSERKNWNVSLRAVKEFEKRHPGEVVYYMHTNPLDERGININALRENLGVGEFTFCPKKIESDLGIDKATLSNAYNCMDVFLLPSKGEGFGVPIIEAQSCGVPVIIPRFTAMRELMGGGWYIEKLRPFWTGQNSWATDCDSMEVVELLEKAYQAKKDGSIVEMQKKAREKALEYSEPLVFEKYWKPELEDITKRIKGVKHGEGFLKTNDWRHWLVPSEAKPAKVIDIGCGLKQTWKPYLSHLGEYTGIDLRDGDGVTQMDAHNLHFPDKTFGFAWCAEMLEHVRDPGKVVTEAKRVARHGAIIFSTPKAADFAHDADHKEVKNVKYTISKDGHGMIIW